MAAAPQYHHHGLFFPTTGRLSVAGCKSSSEIAVYAGLLSSTLLSSTPLRLVGGVPLMGPVVGRNMAAPQYHHRGLFPYLWWRNPRNCVKFLVPVMAALFEILTTPNFSIPVKGKPVV